MQKREYENLSDVDLNKLIINQRNNIKAQGVIEEFNQKFLQALINLKDYDDFLDYNNYLKKVAELSYMVCTQINIENSDQLKKVIGTVGMSETLLNQGIIDKDLESLTVSFDELYYDLKSLQIFTS